MHYQEILLTTFNTIIPQNTLLLVVQTLLFANSIRFRCHFKALDIVTIFDVLPNTCALVDPATNADGNRPFLVIE